MYYLALRIIRKKGIAILKHKQTLRRIDLRKIEVQGSKLQIFAQLIDSGGW